MKKLRLFQKTFLFTTVLMSLIILISHMLIYFLLSKFYIDKKEKEIKVITESLVKQLKSSDEETGIKIAKKYSEKYNINVKLKLGNTVHNFQGFQAVNIEINNLDRYEDFTIKLPNDNEFENYSAEEEDSVGSDLQEYDGIRMIGTSIFNSKSFNTVDGIPSIIQTNMNLQPVGEASNVIFSLLPYSIGVSLIVSLIAAYIYAKAMTNPIKKICSVTKEMENLTEGVYCKINTGDEIGELAGNINSLYDTLWNTITSLEEEIEHVSEMEKMKIDFLRSASHELKTPLMSINIILENMILNIGKYKDHSIYLPKCKEIVGNLSSMVQEILDTSKIQTWRDASKKENINLSEVLINVVESYKLIAKAKGINMIIDYTNSFDVSINKKIFSKALSNIVSNSVNYTESGRKIHIYFKDEELIIENDCIPIPDEYLNHIFEAFYRPDFDRNKSAGGNGLGLYIVEKILKASNLSYSFKSIKTGMRFTIDFSKNRI